MINPCGWGGGHRRSGTIKLLPAINERRDAVLQRTRLDGRGLRVAEERRDLLLQLLAVVGRWRGGQRLLNRVNARVKVRAEVRHGAGRARSG